MRGLEREAVVEQLGRLVHDAGRLLLAAHHHDRDALAVALGAADVGVPGVVGEAGLTADEAGVVAEQLVVVEDRNGRFSVGRRDFEVLRGDGLGEFRLLHRIVEDHAQVVRRGRHAGTVEPRRRRCARVGGADPPCRLVHLGDRGVDAAERGGEGVRDVVAGMHEQAVQQLVDRVVAAGGDPDAGALLLRVLRRRDDHLLWLQRVHHDKREQRLDQGRRALTRVRVFRREHRTRVEVLQNPRSGGVAVGRIRHALRRNHATITHPWASDRGSRDR